MKEYLVKFRYWQKEPSSCLPGTGKSDIQVKIILARSAADAWHNCQKGIKYRPPSFKQVSIMCELVDIHSI